MVWQYTPLLLPIILSGLLSAGGAFIALARSGGRGKYVFTAMVLAAAQWTFAYALELSGANLETKLLLERLTMLGRTTVPVFLALFALQYTDRIVRWHSGYLALFMIPLLTNLLAWLYPANKLLWQDASLVFAGEMHLLQLVYGPIFYLHIGYSYLMCTIGLIAILLQRTNVRGAGRRNVFRGQKYTLLMSILVPWLANLVHILRLQIAPAVELTPFFFLFSSLGLAWSMYGFRLLDVAPLAQEAVLYHMPESILAVDHNGKLQYLNPAAENLLGCRLMDWQGKPAVGLLEKWPEIQPLLKGPAGLKAEIRRGAPQAGRIYLAHASSLHNRAGNFAGWLITVRDITMQKQAEENLQSRAAYLEGFNQLITTAAAAKNLPEMLAQVREQVMRLMGLSNGLIVVLGIESGCTLEAQARASIRKLAKQQDFQQTPVLMVSDWRSPPEFLQTAPDEIEHLRQAGIGASLSAPVRLAEEIIGEMHLFKSQPFTWDNDELALVDALGRQLGVAADRLLQVAESSTLYHALTHLLSPGGSLADVAGQIVAAVESEFRLAHCSVLIHKPEENTLQIIAQGGEMKLWQEWIPADGLGLTVRAFRSGEVVYAPDISQAEGYLLGTEDTRSELAFPLKSHQEVFGVLNLESPVIAGFSKRDRRLLSTFAEQAAIALENAMLFGEVQRLAITDPLTGLYNRRGYITLGQREVERSKRFNRPLSALMIDIDHFKQVNDTYKHATGDQVLRGLARLCSENTRDVDILGRYGGEELVVLLPETNLKGACVAAEHLRALVAEHRFITDAGELSVTISIGAASMSSGEVALEVLIDQADEAMYAAKRAGRNRVMSAQT